MKLQLKIMILASILASQASSAAGNLTAERLIGAPSAGNHWFVKGGGYRGDHYSALDDINVDNVHRLGLAWAADIAIPDGISTTPIVIDGVVYISGAYSIVYALDASSGEILWTHDPEVSKVFAEHPRLSWRARANRGIAVWGGRVYLTTADCKLRALDAATGRVEWTITTCDTAQAYSISDSPYVGGGLVFLGNSGSESQLKNRGYVSAYDAASGELLWRFFIVPSDVAEENDTEALKMAAKTWSREQLAKYGGGGHSWNEMTYDPESNQLFFGTSGAYPYAHRERSPDGGDNLFLSSIVAVNAQTGEYNWHYQTVDRDSWDYNATMNIVAADLEIGGKRRETVLIAPKNGFHYALDRHTGELLTAGKFSRVTWATHINMETGRPVYDPSAEYWNIPDGETVQFWPNWWGSHSWNPMAYHPGLSLSYIPVVDVPSVVNNEGTGEDIVMVTEIDGKPHSPGKIVAFDPAAGAIRWTVEHELPFNGGLMATAGNLLFQGNAQGELVAYAADKGTRLWSVATGSAINAAPASYAVNGEQYVLIPIGAGGGIQFLYPQMHAAETLDGPTRLLAFSLDSEQTVPSKIAEARPLPEQPALEASDEEIAAGAAFYSDECKFCHGFKAVARRGSTVPDLRYADSDTHATWHAIVVGGARKANGMPAIELSIDESEAIRNYVLSLSAGMRLQQKSID